jgi:hypothetical protein
MAAPPVSPPPNRRWIVYIPIVSAVLLAVVMICLRAQAGDMALRIRITRALHEGGGEALVMTNLAAFTWDELVVLGPKTSNEVQSEAGGLPFYVRWMVGLSNRDDICVLAFKIRARYRGHVVMPRKSGDFLPAAQATAFTTETAVFHGTLQDGAMIVRAAPALPSETP